MRFTGFRLPLDNSSVGSKSSGALIAFGSKRESVWSWLMRDALQKAWWASSLGCWALRVRPAELWVTHWSPTPERALDLPEPL